MWRYISGASDPKKRKIEDKEKKDRDREYEKTERNRTFCEKWKQGRESWLNFDPKSKMMTCSVCQRFAVSEQDKKSNFVTGSKNMRLEAISYHEKCNLHIKSINAEKELSQKPGESSAEKALIKLNESAVDRMRILFRNVHALVMQRRPFTDFKWLLDLDEKKGLNVGKTYRNDKEAQLFSEYIAQSTRINIAQLVLKAPFISVITDGATDKSFTENEIVYIRSASGGVVNVHFAGISSVEKADADGIVNAIDGVFKKLNVPDYKQKLVGFGSDGASVNTGKKNGVIAKLKNEQPALVGIHCHAHRLELAYKDALKKQSQHSKIEELLSSLYYFYRNSPLNRADLKRSCSVLGLPTSIPTRIGGTRWLPHWLRALENMWKGYPAIVSHLQTLTATSQTRKSEALGKARGILNSLLDLDLMTYAQFLTDVISTLSKLSLLLQNQHCLVSEIHHHFLATIDVVTELKTRDGPRLRKFREDIILSEDGKTSYKDVTLSADSHRSSHRASFEDNRVETINMIIQSMSTRFDDQQSHLLKAAQFADFRYWSRDAVSGFANDDVRTLLNHFTPVLITAGFDVDEVENEWSLLKGFIYTSGCDISSLTWNIVNDRYQQRCSNFLALIDILLTLPASSSDAERGFSEMKMTKTDWRCSLRSTVLDDLMMIQLNSVPILTFDPLPAIVLWNKSSIRERRPYYMEEFDDDHESD